MFITVIYTDLVLSDPPTEAMNKVYTHRHTYKKTGIRCAMYSDGESIAVAQKLRMFILYIQI